ncbi:hypothetical protein ACEPAG_4262 [Sanghuangporus baumii]
MIWFAPIIVFLAQALVLVHADVCRTLDVINTFPFPYHRHASTHLYGLICSSTSQESDYAPHAPQPETSSLSTPESVSLSLPAPKHVALLIVLPSSTPAVAPFIPSDTCPLFSHYSPYTVTPPALSTEPTCNASYVDDQDPAAHYQVSHALSTEVVKTEHPQPIHVQVYIALAVCCISTLLCTLIVVSRKESTQVKETFTLPRRRAKTTYRTESEVDGGHNRSSLMFIHPESQYPFTDMVYEIAIASTRADWDFTTTQAFDGTANSTANLKTEHHLGGNTASGQQKRSTVNPRFNSSDGSQQDRKTSLPDSRLLYANAGTTSPIFNKDNGANHDKPCLKKSMKKSMKKSKKRSNVNAMSNNKGLACTTSNDITGVTVSASEQTLVGLPSQKDGLGSKSDSDLLRGLIESSGSSDGSDGFASASSTLKDGMGDLLDKVNGDKKISYGEQTDGLKAAGLNCSAHATVSSHDSQENERAGIPLGLIASIWARGMKYLSRQSSASVNSESDLTEVASQPEKNTPFGVSTSSTVASTQSSPPVSSTSASGSRKDTRFLCALHTAIKESVEGIQKEGFWIIPDLLRSILTRDVTDGQFAPNSVPSETDPSSSRHTPREVGKFTHSPSPARSRSEGICTSAESDHRDSLPTTPGATPLECASSCSSSSTSNINNESACKSSAEGKHDTSGGSTGDAHATSQPRRLPMINYKPGRGPSGLPWIRRPI